MTGRQVVPAREAAWTAPGGVGQVRLALVRRLRDAQFSVDVERTTLIEAARGSMIAGALVKERLPVQVVVRLTPAAAGTDVHVRLSDRWLSAAAVRGLETLYPQLFDELTGLLHAAAPGDGAGAGRPVEGGGASSGLLGRIGDSLTGAARSAMGSVDSRLQGRREEQPQRWAAVLALDVELDGTVTRLGRDEVDDVLDVAALVGAQPAGMPPSLVGHVERLAARVEERLDAGVPVPVLELEKADAPALTFLRQQAALRSALPQRRMLVCRDCRLEKVVNDDYQRLATRNRKLNDMVNRVALGPVGMVRQLLRTQAPDFVCPRCQGLTADTFVVTFCSACGAQHKTGALARCECGLDFRAEGEKRLAERPPFRLPEPVTPMPEPVRPPQPPAQPPQQTQPPVQPQPPVLGPRPPRPVAVPYPPVTPAPPVAPAPPTPQAPAGQVTVQYVPAGWYPDPWAVARLRYWDGAVWTGHVQG